MIRKYKKEIDGATYEGMTLPARKGLSVGSRLLKLVGPALGKLSGASGVAGILGGDDSGLVAEAIGLLVQRIGETDVARLCMDMFQGCFRTGTYDDTEQRVKMEPSKEDDFDIIYNANYGELAKALAYMVEVNLPGFFEKLPIGKVWAKAKAAIDSQLSGSE